MHDPRSLQGIRAEHGRLLLLRSKSLRDRASGIELLLLVHKTTRGEEIRQGGDRARVPVGWDRQSKPAAASDGHAACATPVNRAGYTQLKGAGERGS